MLQQIRYTLQAIGAKRSTDKASHKFNGISYLHVFDIYFKYWRDVPMNILELGVKNGASLRTWKDYFRKGKIYGLDINPNCKNKQEKNIHIEIGHQDDKKIIDKLYELTGKKGFDIILDDCSHINELTLKSFKLLWPCLKSKGLYVIEDLRNSYTKELEKDMRKGGWKSPFQKKKINLVNNREDMDIVFKHIIKELDYRTGDKQFIHFWPMICIIGKI